jgi:hypothetical protein
MITLGKQTLGWLTLKTDLRNIILSVMFFLFVCFFLLIFFVGVPHSATFIFVIFVYVIASIAYGAPPKHQVLEHQQLNNQVLKHQLSKTGVLNLLILVYPQIRLKPTCIPPNQNLSHLHTPK